MTRIILAASCAALLLVGCEAAPEGPVPVLDALVEAEPDVAGEGAAFWVDDPVAEGSRIVSQLVDEDRISTTVEVPDARVTTGATLLVGGRDSVVALNASDGESSTSVTSMSWSPWLGREVTADPDSQEPPTVEFGANDQEPLPPPIVELGTTVQVEPGTCVELRVVQLWTVLGRRGDLVDAELRAVEVHALPRSVELCEQPEG